MLRLSFLLAGGAAKGIAGVRRPGHLPLAITGVRPLRGRCPGSLRALCALAGLLAVCGGLFAETLTGRVRSVADGDTVTLVDSAQVPHKIRLAGIDAPEARQPYGQVSRRSLAEMVEGQWVQVSYDKRDRYGRLVGKIELHGRDVNLEQLRRGLAWHFKKYQDEQSPSDRQAYAKAEEEAQSARLGLWRDAQPQAPWDWRAATRPTDNDPQ